MASSDFLFAAAIVIAALLKEAVDIDKQRRNSTLGCIMMVSFVIYLCVFYAIKYCSASEKKDTNLNILNIIFTAVSMILFLFGRKISVRISKEGKPEQPIQGAEQPIQGAENV
ncbi:hypothetical protein MOSE0_I05996 [Monosporozyma servazzii]